LNHEVGVVTRLKDKKMAQPYRKLKVPDSISHVSVDDIKSAQQSDESLVKIGEQVKSEAVLVDFAYTTLSLLPQSKVNQYIPSLTLFL
jgi:hypothetical protein